MGLKNYISKYSILAYLIELVGTANIDFQQNLIWQD